MVLYEAASGISYWQGYNELEITNALLGFTLLPHLADENVLSRCVLVCPNPWALFAMHGLCALSSMLLLLAYMTRMLVSVL